MMGVSRKRPENYYKGLDQNVLPHRNSLLNSCLRQVYQIWHDKSRQYRISLGYAANLKSLRGSVRLLRALKVGAIVRCDYHFMATLFFRSLPSNSDTG